MISWFSRKQSYVALSTTEAKYVVACSASCEAVWLRKLLCDASSNLVDATIYHQMIGSVMCLMNTRPNVCFAMNTLSQFLTDPRHAHLVATKYVLRYLKGTIYYGLKYDANQKINLHGYVDSDWASNATDGKSTLGCCFSLGFGMISWFCRKHFCVALSTIKAEYC